MHRHGSTSRRAFLRGALVVAGAGLTGGLGLAGCDPFAPDPTTEPPTHELDTFLAATVALGDQYDETMIALPDLAAQLTPLRDATRAHAGAVAAAIGIAVPASTGTATAPTDRASALAALAAAEKSARDQAGTTCLSSSARLAPLLGSIAAARACHLEVLR